MDSRRGQGGDGFGSHASCRLHRHDGYRQTIGKRLREAACACAQVKEGSGLAWQVLPHACNPVVQCGRRQRSPCPVDPRHRTVIVGAGSSHLATLPAKPIPGAGLHSQKLQLGQPGEVTTLPLPGTSAVALCSSPRSLIRSSPTSLRPASDARFPSHPIKAIATGHASAGVTPQALYREAKPVRICATRATSHGRITSPEGVARRQAGDRIDRTHSPPRGEAKQAPGSGPSPRRSPKPGKAPQRRITPPHEGTPIAVRDILRRCGVAGVHSALRLKCRRCRVPATWPSRLTGRASH